MQEQVLRAMPRVAARPRPPPARPGRRRRPRPRTAAPRTPSRGAGCAAAQGAMAARAPRRAAAPRKRRLRRRRRTPPVPAWRGSDRRVRRGRGSALALGEHQVPQASREQPPVGRQARSCSRSSAGETARSLRPVSAHGRPACPASSRNTPELPGRRRSRSRSAAHQADNSSEAGRNAAPCRVRRRLLVLGAQAHLDHAGPGAQLALAAGQAFAAGDAQLRHSHRSRPVTFSVTRCSTCPAACSPP